MPSRCTSLVLHSKPVQQNCLRFFKNFKKQCALQGLMKLKLLRELLLLTNFLHQKVRKNKKTTKGSSFKMARGFFFLTLRLPMPHMWFSELFKFQSFFSHLLLVLELKTKFIEFWTKFRKKQVKFLSSSTAKLAAFS